MMGYGLTDLAENDPRINPGSLVHSGDLRGRRVLQGYYAWLEERGHGDPVRGIDRSDAPAERRRAFDVQDCIQLGNEDYGMRSVLCIRPLAWTDWYRYDDPIDWHEQTYSEGGQRDDVQVFRHGIYPHVSYMDDRDGERIKGGDVHAWHRLRHRLEDGGGADGYGDCLLEDMAREMGFASHEDALAHCHPHVPDEVRWLAEFAELFTDQSTALQLRPMVYTWWA